MNNQYPWEDVSGSPCPICGCSRGTIWETSEKRTYHVDPHSRMGNKSHRQDSVVREYCRKCNEDEPISSWRRPDAPSVERLVELLSHQFVGNWTAVLLREKGVEGVTPDALTEKLAARIGATDGVDSVTPELVWELSHATTQELRRALRAVGVLKYWRIQIKRSGQEYTSVAHQWGRSPEEALDREAGTWLYGTWEGYARDRPGMTVMVFEDSPPSLGL